MEHKTPSTGAQISHSTVEKRIKQFLVSLDELFNELKTSGSNKAKSWIAERVEDLLHSIEKCAKSRVYVKAKDDHAGLDSRGTELWNMTTKLLRSEKPSDVENKNTHLKLRHLAYLTLDCAQRTCGRTTQGGLRLVKIAVKAGKTYLDHNEVSLADSVLSNAAKYIDDLSKNATPLQADEEMESINLECEFLIQRIELSFLQHNINAAELMCNNAMERFSRDESAAVRLEPRIRESLGKVLYKIGKDMVKRANLTTGIQWLARALEIVDTEHVGSERFAAELRFGIMQNLVQTSLKTEAPSDLQKAEEVMEVMVKEWPERLSVHCLGLDIIVAQKLGAEAYHAALMKMMSTVVLSERSFKAIVGKCHVLLAQDLQGRGGGGREFFRHRLACNVLDHFVTDRLTLEDNQGWIEQVFVTRVWMIVQDAHLHDEEVIQGLQQMCEATSTKLAKPLSISATHASQILLWKVSDTLVTGGRWLEAIQWCRVALHSIFQRSGETNTGKIARRLIHCAIEAHDYGAARDAYESMPSSCQETGSTQFLLFKIALKALDLETAKGCLDKICNGPNRDIAILYSCALEAQSMGNKDIILKVLGQLLEQADTTTPPEGANLPAIYRTMIRLILSDIQDNKAVENGNLDAVYSMFQKALNNAIKSKTSEATADDGASKSMWSTDEYDWFSRNSYNLALRALQHWPPQYALHFSQLCVQFIKLYPPEVCSEEDVENLNLRRSFCEYICASTCVALARKEEKMEDQLQHYGNARKSIINFREIREKLHPKLTEQSQRDFGERYLGLLSHEFEACVHLEVWGDLPGLVEEVAEFGQMQPLRRIGDMILCADAPTATLLLVLENLINHTLKIEKHKVDKIARWIRVLLQKSLQGDFNRAERLVYQVLDICKRRAVGNEYPQDELEWIAASLWNLGIDKNCAGDFPGSKKWAEFALSIAAFVKDGGQLENLLQGKFAKLRTS
ncbi:hypothetical protein TWF481_006675 [Arthrobotrys musiformis]|uniref:Protein ZIP4 homolog n=1 Tax=Arthrobotrys musiformis TaxID=47236 RepID=A0AAV9W980_9PEZI